MSDRSQPPIAEYRPHETEVHGDRRSDPYFWLRDRKDPAVSAYLEAENSYTAAYMEPFQPLEDRLYREMVGRIQEYDQSVPVRIGEYLYYARTERAKEYPIYCRKLGSAEGAEEILLDVNVLAQGEAYFRIGGYRVSPDQTLLAYSTDVAGDEAYTIFIKELATGRILTDRIKNTNDTLEWGKDNRTIFYTVLDAARRPWQVYRHVLGEDASTLLYQEDDQRFTVDLSRPKNGPLLFLDIASAVTSEVRYLDAHDPVGEFRVILPRRQDVEYDVTLHGDFFYIRTNDGAKNFRVVKAPVTDPAPENWQEVFPASEQVTIEYCEAFADHLVAYERENGLPLVRVLRFSDCASHRISFLEPAYDMHGEGNEEFQTNVLRFSYTSLVTPRSIFDYNLDTGERELRKQTAVPGGYDPTRYRTERLFAQAPDGVKVPISLLYRVDVAEQRPAPMLLYGYGSYGISIDPAFSTDRLSLVDRGLIYAIAHIRGGGEMGERWHDAGKLLDKKNTFADFIAAAEHLIEAGYTAPDRLVANGRSAGGLLMGAVANLRPDLFRGILAQVPYVDALNTGLDATLPLTVEEYEEWGDPNQKAFYDYIRSYSPYDNVRSMHYPAFLITGGLNDPRVSYWEPAKWTARLRALKTDQNILLLKTDMGSGHFGASGRYEHRKQTAFEYAFLLSLLEIGT